MIIGIPGTPHEKTGPAGLVPGSVRALVNQGHTVLVEKNAGSGAGIKDDEFSSSGAELATHAKLYSRAEMLIKAGHLDIEELDDLSEGQILFAFFHLEQSKQAAEAVLDKRIIAMAHEMLRTDTGEFPALRPVDEITGRVAVIQGSRFLQQRGNGRGVVLGGVTGIEKGEVCIIGAGITGLSAGRTAMGLGARVTILDPDPAWLLHAADILPSATTLVLNPESLARGLARADLVIGTITGPGGKHAVARNDISVCQKGTVLMDTMMNRGGCFATSRLTNEDAPAFIKNGIMHVCIPDLTALVPRSTSYALSNATLPYIMKIANFGINSACAHEAALLSAMLAYNGVLTNAIVANELDLPSTPFRPRTVM